MSRGLPVQWGDSKWQAKLRKPQETLEWVLNIVKSKNKGTVFLKNWPPEFPFSASECGKDIHLGTLGQRVFKGLCSVKHDLVVFSMFTNTFWNIYIKIYIKMKLWTAGQEHCSTRRTFFQVPWHRGLPIACQWRVWFLKWYFENVSYTKANQRWF